MKPSEEARKAIANMTDKMAPWCYIRAAIESLADGLDSHAASLDGRAELPLAEDLRCVHGIALNADCDRCPEPSDGGDDEGERFRLHTRSEDGQRGFQDGMLQACRLLGYGDVNNSLEALVEFIRAEAKKWDGAEETIAELRAERDDARKRCERLGGESGNWQFRSEQIQALVDARGREIAELRAENEELWALMLRARL